jgi:hypothetical protein
MMVNNLGRLERVELRNIWLSEASDFTPWLARKENLAILGETLGIDLELEAQERPVGPFRADILCKDIGTDRWVLIENQLERTDQSHLGQLLTYASGLEAVTIVWVAARFTEEHRSTLDWLNRITDESFRFFGLEVELWRIGDSSAALKFNVISKPNDWSQSVDQAARAIDDAELSETRIMQRAYWIAFDTVLAALGGPVSGGKKPQPQSWMAYSIGRSHFSVVRPRFGPKDRFELNSIFQAIKRRHSFICWQHRRQRSNANWDLRSIGRNCRKVRTAEFQCPWMTRTPSTRLIGHGSMSGSPSD